MGKVADLDELVADVCAEGVGFLMRTAQKLVQHPELVHDLKGRGMDRVAAEITQEICMLFEDQHGDSGAGQQQSQHHASGTASGDAAADRNLVVRHWRSLVDCAPVGAGLYLTLAEATCRVGFGALPRDSRKPIASTNPIRPPRAIGIPAPGRVGTSVRLDPLCCSTRDEVEDVPVLILAELGFARMILFGKVDDHPSAQQLLDIAAGVKVHPALRYVPAVVGTE